MKTTFRIVFGAIAVVLVAALGLALYVLFGDLSVHKDRVLAAASDASGFYIGSEGPFDLDVGKQTSLSIENVIVGNPAFPDEHPLASVGSLRVVVDTRSLIQGPVEIVSLSVGSTYVNLKQADDGRANWIPAADDAATAASDESAPLPILHELSLDDVNVNFEEGGETQFVVNKLLLRATRNARNDYKGGIAVNFGAPSLDNMLVGQGSLQFGPAIDAISTVRVEIDDAVFEQTGVSDLKARLSGFASADLAGEKPAISASIDVAQLFFAAIESEAADSAEPETGELLFPTTPLSYSWLGGFDLQAGLRIGEAILDGENVRDVDIATTIRSGELHVDPASLVLGDGTVSGNLHLVPSDAGYALEVSASVANLKLAQLAAEGQARETVPPLNVELALQGSGQSMHDIMASSNGKVTGRQGTGQLDRGGAGPLFSDMLTSIVRTLNPLAEERSYADIECGILDINIEDGVANVEELAMQSDRLTIVGSGKIDFSDESIDLNVNTKSREGLGLSVGGVANSFVKIGGTLREPALGVDAAGTVRTTGAAVATGGLSVIAKGLWDRLSSEVDLCSLPDQEAEADPSD